MDRNATASFDGTGHPGRKARPRAVLGALVLLSALPATVGVADKGRPVDLALSFEVIWGDESMGPESLREEVALHALRRLEEARCFASISAVVPPDGESGDPAADVMLAVTLSRLEIRERWDVSIAERTSPDRAPGETDNQVEATVGFDVSMVLRALPEAIPLRTRSWRHEQSYRPQQGEDPREAVRRQVIDDLGRDAAGFACKNVAKLPTQIARARATAAD